MADTASEPTADRCKLNATLSSSVHDKSELLSFYQQWSDKYDEVTTLLHIALYYTVPCLLATANFLSKDVAVVT